MSYSFDDMNIDYTGSGESMLPPFSSQQSQRPMNWHKGTPTEETDSSPGFFGNLWNSAKGVFGYGNDIATTGSEAANFAGNTWNKFMSGNMNANDLTSALSQAINLYNKGKDLYSQGKDIYNQGRNIYNQGRDAYNDMRGGNFDWGTAARDVGNILTNSGRRYSSMPKRPAVGNMLTMTDKRPRLSYSARAGTRQNLAQALQEE